MPQDAINLNKLASELSGLLEDGKINKITMPEKDEVHLFVYAKGKNHKLVVSANSTSPRVHTTTSAKDNPLSPPGFCMLLRKHLQNGNISRVSCDLGERIIRMEIDSKTELSDNAHFTLLVELMARRSNMFLLAGSGKILGSLRQISLDESGNGNLVGMKYQMPKNDRLNPYIAVEIKTGLSEFCGGDFPAFVLEKFSGFAKSTAEELGGYVFGKGDCNNVSVDFDLEKACEKFEEFHTLGTNPRVYCKNGKMTDFCYIPYSALEEDETVEKVAFDSFCEALDYFYTTKDNLVRFGEKSKVYKQAIKNAISRWEKKLKGQKKQLEDCDNMTKNQLYGELITSYMYMVKPGDKTLACVNYYDNSEVEIPLVVQYSPQENAQKYYKAYQKQKRTFVRVSADISETESYLESLRVIRAGLERITDPRELDGVKEDLTYLKLLRQNNLKQKAVFGKKGKVKKVEKTAITPQKYNVEGVDVYVGKSSLQNDFVSFKIARGNDVWFHINKYTGAHVVAKISLDDISDSVLTTCAEIASFYSDAKNAGKAVVDYTPAKNLTKPPHSPLGLVIYHTNYSLAVEPNAHDDLKV